MHFQSSRIDKEKYKLGKKKKVDKGDGHLLIVQEVWDKKENKLRGHVVLQDYNAKRLAKKAIRKELKLSPRQMRKARREKRNVRVAE